LTEQKNNIRILPDNLVNIIAAGEVVERPASVIKELVENSIDAGASRITVKLEEAGRKLIQVTDDGMGMSHDNALMSVERHATSKVREASDLGRLSTLGFRGEALPSIASVGRFVLETWDGSAAEGTRITLDSGKLVDVSGCGRARGTSVSLRGIFSRLPARRKFLRTRETELSWCLAAVEDASLTRPDIHFELYDGSAIVLQLPPVDDLKKRISSLWGSATASAMMRIDSAVDGVTAAGYISPPSETFSRRMRHKVMVNGRPVRDPVLNRVISVVLADMYPGGRFPALVLALEMPSDLVDVNVHPAKREVRIRRSREIGEAIRQAVSAIRTRRAAAPAAYREDDAGTAGDAARETALPLSYGHYRNAAPATEAGAGLEQPADSTRRIIGQFHMAYILYEENGILNLVDQHAAHERIMYNRLLQRAGEGPQASQTLAVPILLETGPGGAANLKARAGHLERLGFRLEEFGQGAMRFSAVPAALSGEASASLLEKIALDLAGTDPVPEEIALLVSRAACKMSVRAGTKLTGPEMERLVDDLLEAEAGLACPHGRPTRISLGTAEVEKMFKRR
jgi:DNA mismatch repair protein MutL